MPHALRIELAHGFMRYCRNAGTTYFMRYNRVLGPTGALKALAATYLNRTPIAKILERWHGLVAEQSLRPLRVSQYAH